MKFFLVPLPAGVMVLAADVSPAQDTRSGIPGVLRSDGTFRPFVVHPIVPPTSGTEVMGTATVTLTITLVTSFPEGTTIQCGLSASAVGESAGGVLDDYGDSASVPATVQGSTATCSPTIPYEWLLYGTGDQFGTTYSVTALNSAGLGRTTSGIFATIAMPANGATTRHKVKTRL